MKCVGELSYQCNDRDLDTRLACMWAAGVGPIKNLCACTVSATIMVTQMCKGASVIIDDRHHVLSIKLPCFNQSFYQTLK
jgi:hypothetical protein